jgi:hypothetical protein
MLTKEQMEEAWRSGPINFLKNHCTKTKGQKLFKVNITPYVKTELKEHSKTYEVWAKKEADAVWEAEGKWWSEHRDIEKSGTVKRIVS